MSLNAVQLHVKGLLDGLVLPGDLGTLTAYITPPSPDYVDQPVIYIWGSTQQERRRTAPRSQHGNLSTGGFKQVTHRVDAWLLWFGQPDEPGVDNLFPLAIDAVNARIRNAPMPVLGLTDPITGAVSNIDSIGENIDTDYAPVHQLDDQTWYAYNARHTFEIVEKIQA